MKLKIFAGLLIFAFGCFIGNKFSNSSAPPAMEQHQAQDQGQKQGQDAQGGCVAEVGKKTNPDGSIEDFFRFKANMKANQGQNSNQSQAQEQKITPVDSTIDIFGGGGVSSKKQGWGAAEAIAGRHSFEYLTNGPEWIGLYKIKLISF
jgi:hypothetical protein